MKATQPTFAIRLKRYKNDGSFSGTVEYVAHGYANIPELRTPGGTRTGVGVAKLWSWKTRAGVEKFMREYATWFEALNRVGLVEIV